MARQTVLACDATPEGVLAGVGITYLAHARDGEVRLASVEALQPQLGEAVVRVPDSRNDDVASFARRVLVGFSNKLGSPRIDDIGDEWSQIPGWGNACTRRLAYATASDDPDMPEIVHRYLRLGFAEGSRAWRMIADARVVAYDGLARFVVNECEHTRQFVRFAHMADGSYAASFVPKANTIPLTATHFACRMGSERFFIVDPRHRVAAFHEAGQRTCQITRIDARIARDLATRTDFADDERYVRAMWQRFYRGTATPGRDRGQRGYDLRTSWMPQRLWSGLSELDRPVDTQGLKVPARYTGTDAERTIGTNHHED